jgi:hypothetical protein
MIQVIYQDQIVTFADALSARTEAEKISWLTDEPVEIRYADGSTETVKIDA